MYRDLEILRDKNGRPISQYLDVVDGKFKPITKDNYPELQKVKDEDVKTELESIKQTQSEILERLDGTFDAQLSGSNVEYRRVETILPRGVRREQFNNATFEQPLWANRAIFYLIVHGISGTFEEGEGVNLETLLFGVDSARYYGLSHEPSTTSRITQITEWSPGVNSNDVYVRGGSSYKAIPIHFVSDIGNYRIRVQITGVFEEGEGVDCEIKVAWLRG